MDKIELDISNEKYNKELINKNILINFLEIKFDIMDLLLNKVVI